MAVRFNSDPRLAKQQYALNQAQQRREVARPTEIPSVKPTHAGDKLDSSRTKTSGQGALDRALAQSLWSDEDAGRGAVLRRLASGPIDINQVLAACAKVKNEFGGDVDDVRSNVGRRLEGTLARAAKSGGHPAVVANAATSLVAVARAKLADPETTTVALARALEHLDLARLVIVPVVSDAALRSTAAKKAASVDALRERAHAALVARAEVVIADSERAVAIPDGHPSTSFYTLVASRQHLSAEQAARFDAVCVRASVKNCRASQGWMPQMALDAAARCDFEGAERIMANFRLSRPELVDAAGAYLSAAERDEARQVFSAHDASVEATRRGIEELLALAATPSAGSA